MAIVTQGVGLALVPLVLIIGFGGAFISLRLSKWLIKRIHGVELVDGEDSPPKYQWQVADVRELSQQAGLEKVPEVGV